MKVGILCTNAQWADRTKPFWAIYSALVSLGHTVQIAVPSELAPFSVEPEAVIIWNGRKGMRGRITDLFREKGIPTIIVERGFFDRAHHAQIDAVGFNHTASWVPRLHELAPEIGFRLDAMGIKPQPFVQRKGYALVLGQTPGDAQLDSLPVHPDELLDLVQAAAGDVEVRYRPHPNVVREQRPLADDLAGAAFCLTINSNAGNDALAVGVPVLAFGPALYTIAGVAKRTTPEALVEDMAAMRRGWKPEDNAVASYLCWLACRQYTNEEFAEGKVLFAVLSGLDPWPKAMPVEAPGSATPQPAEGEGEPAVAEPEPVPAGPLAEGDADVAGEGPEVAGLNDDVPPARRRPAKRRG
jgi:hypothetical protein